MKHRYALYIIGAACLVLFMLSSALSEPCNDYPVKAGFIYNFTIFTDWPESSPPGAKAPLNICVCDMAVVGRDLDALTGKAVKNRKIILRKWLGPLSAQDCHVLFINSDDTDIVRKALSSVKEKPVLTVGETEGFAEMGGIINILQKDGQYYLEINLDAARLASLKISSRLLSLKRTRIIRSSLDKKENSVLKSNMNMDLRKK